MNRPVITLLTDFGLRDTFVGQMKGVLLQHCPDAAMVDLTHSIPPQSIVAGSMHLAAAWKAFPAGTVHLAVVDPGVGTERRAIALRFRGHRFVLPDNGLISAVLEEEDPEQVVVLPTQGPEVDEVSRTFHGRDVFAPVAGRLASGVPLDTLGASLESSLIERLPLSRPRVHDDRIEGEIALVDHFGNAVSNISQHLVGDEASVAEVQCGPFSVHDVSGTYQDVAPGDPVALISSMSTLELAVRDGSAAAEYGLKPGMTVVIRRRW